MPEQFNYLGIENFPVNILSNGLEFRVNGRVLSTAIEVYAWYAPDHTYLVYAVVIDLNKGDVVTLTSVDAGMAVYQEFSGYCLDLPAPPTLQPTAVPSAPPTLSPTFCVAPAPAKPLNIGFSILSPAITSTVVNPGSNAFSGYTAGSAIVDYDITAGLAGGWDNMGFEYLAPSAGCVRLAYRTNIRGRLLRRYTRTQRPPSDRPTHMATRSYNIYTFSPQGLPLQLRGSASECDRRRECPGAAIQWQRVGGHVQSAGVVLG